MASLHSGGADEGRQVFRVCAGCHSLRPGENRIGPSLAGLFGRKAGSVPGFRYSEALRQSNVVWNDRSLDAWIAGPQQFVPGSRMPFAGLKQPDRRAALIDYLKEATRPAGAGSGRK